MKNNIFEYWTGKECPLELQNQVIKAKVYRSIENANYVFDKYKDTTPMNEDKINILLHESYPVNLPEEITIEYSYVTQEEEDRVTTERLSQPC